MGEGNLSWERMTGQEPVLPPHQPARDGPGPVADSNRRAMMMPGPGKTARTMPADSPDKSSPPAPATGSRGDQHK